MRVLVSFVAFCMILVLCGPAEACRGRGLFGRHTNLGGCSSAAQPNQPVGHMAYTGGGGCVGGVCR